MKKNNNNSIMMFLDERGIKISMGSTIKKQYSFQKNGVPPDNYGLIYDFTFKIIKSLRQQYPNAIQLLVVDDQFARIRENSVMKYGAKNHENADFNTHYNYYWEFDFRETIIDKLSSDFEELLIVAFHELLQWQINANNNLVVFIRNRNTKVIKFINGSAACIAHVNAGLCELISQISSCFQLPPRIALKLYKTYGNTLINKRLNNVIIDIKLSEFVTREVALTDLVHLIQQYFITLFKASQKPLEQKKLTMQNENVYVLGEHISHIRVQELAGLYFGQHCNQLSLDEIIAKDVSDNIQHLATVKSQAEASMHVQKTYTCCIDAPQSKARSVFKDIVTRVRSEWQIYMNEPESSAIS
ncbi:MAG TPA: hypothetical protein PLM49_08615 [Bacteroidales bacterium]|nr:hypothetical protein [Bacteroidales bacterium]